MKKILITALLLSGTLSLSAQQEQHFTLEECMRYAVENNNTIKIQQYDNLNLKQDKTEAIASFFPSLSASSSFNNSYGRSIDPETNTYTTSGNLSNSYGVNTYLTIFNGLGNINTLKASQVRMEMGQHNLQQQSDQTALSVMKLYYDALYFENSVEITREQLDASTRVELLTQKQLELGVKSEADVAQAVAQVASYDLLLTQQQSRLAQTLLDLKEAMNFPFDVDITLDSVVNMEIEEFLPEGALEHNPEVLSARSKVKESKLNLKIARSGYYPTIGIGAGYNTNYFKMLDSQNAQRIFFDQLKDNYGYYVGASISIPIFNGLQRRSNVIRSKNSIHRAELELNNTKLRIEKQVRDALLQRESSLKEQIGATRKIEASTISSNAMLRKYEQGMVSIIDLQKSSNDLLIAKAEELRAKFNYLVQCIMIRYYSGEKIY